MRNLKSYIMFSIGWGVASTTSCIKPNEQPVGFWEGGLSSSAPSSHRPDFQHSTQDSFCLCHLSKMLISQVP